MLVNVKEKHSPKGRIIRPKTNLPKYEVDFAVHEVLFELRSMKCSKDFMLWGVDGMNL